MPGTSRRRLCLLSALRFLSALRLLCALRLDASVLFAGPVFLVCAMLDSPVRSVDQV